jgi:hypothetical protein
VNNRCTCDAQWSGKDEAEYVARGCPECTCRRMPLVCSWCNSEGQIIGKAKSFPGILVAKCTKCHHEWETR